MAPSLARGVWLFAGTLVLGSALLSADAASEKDNIASIADEWKTRYNAGNAAKVAELYATDGYYLSSHVLAKGRKEIEAYFRKGIEAGGHIDFIKVLKVEKTDDMAYCAGTYQATNAGVTVDGRVLLVFKLVNGAWLISAHETAVRDQP